MCAPSAASNGLCNINGIAHCSEGKMLERKLERVSIIMIIIMMFVSMFWVSGQWSMVNVENDTVHRKVHNSKHQFKALNINNDGCEFALHLFHLSIEHK